MATKPREWPNNAREQRDEAADCFTAIIGELVPLLRMKDERVTRSELLRRVAMAVNYAQNGVRWLENAGAPTRPIE